MDFQKTLRALSALANYSIISHVQARRFTGTNEAALLHTSCYSGIHIIVCVSGEALDAFCISAHSDYKFCLVSQGRLHKLRLVVKDEINPINKSRIPS